MMINNAKSSSQYKDREKPGAGFLMEMQSWTTCLSISKPPVKGLTPKVMKLLWLDLISYNTVAFPV